MSPGAEVASLLVHYPGDGSSGRKPILLIGHMDVVDAIRSNRERDPFPLVQEDGYFFRRGTAGNKTGITMLTETFLRADTGRLYGLAAGLGPARKVNLASPTELSRRPDGKPAAYP